MAKPAAVSNNTNILIVFLALNKVHCRAPHIENLPLQGVAFHEAHMGTVCACAVLPTEMVRMCSALSSELEESHGVFVVIYKTACTDFSLK